MSQKVLNEIEKEGQNIRKYYQQRLPSNPKKDYYFMLRDTPNNESIIVEYGFIDSTGDDAEQIKNNYKDYAEAVVKAVAEYKGIKYIPISDEYYVVKKGDTLWGIAKKYNISVSELKSINDLSTNTLKIGQLLKITPEIKISGVEKDNYIKYTVQKGDNLYNIANKYNTTVNTIKEINNLSTTLLQIGQVLNLPNSFKSYIVQKGDSLWKIANEFDTSVSNLTKINDLNTTTLQIGQILLVPNN